MKKKKILVTGADGFIGSHLVEALVNGGYDVRAFVAYNSFNTWGWLDTSEKKIIDAVEVIPGDIRDQNGVQKAVDGCDVVLHLAALLTLHFLQFPSIDTNIMGTLNVCRQQGLAVG